MVSSQDIKVGKMCCVLFFWFSYLFEPKAYPKEQVQLSTFFRGLNLFVFLSVLSLIFSLKVKQIKVRHWQGWIVPSRKQTFAWNFTLASQKVFLCKVLGPLSKEERVILSMSLPRSFISSQANWMLLCQRALYFHPKEL